LVPFIIIGVGVALSLAPCTESVMGSLPTSQAGVGSATNDTAMQLGGALGVGVLGTLLNLRYQHLMAHAAARANVPAPIQKLIDSSLGTALAVAHRAPKNLGDQLASVARHAFVSGMDEALLIATVVVGVAALVIAVMLPNHGSSANPN
jgi:hypothetical protein